MRLIDHKQREVKNMRHLNPELERLEERIAPCLPPVVCVGLCGAGGDGGGGGGGSAGNSGSTNGSGSSASGSKSSKSKSHGSCSS